MTIRVPFRCAAVAAFLIVQALATGCSSEPATGQVKGTVSYNGSPVKSGTVNFLSAAGAGAQATIDESGHFTLDAPLDASEYTAYVNPPVPEPHAPGTKAKSLPKFTVPQKFRDPSSSGVKVKVQAGENYIPVEMKD